MCMYGKVERRGGKNQSKLFHQNEYKSPFHERHYQQTLLRNSHLLSKLSEKKKENRRKDKR